MKVKAVTVVQRRYVSLQGGHINWNTSQIIRCCLALFHMPGTSINHQSYWNMSIYSMLLDNSNTKYSMVLNPDKNLAIRVIVLGTHVYMVRHGGGGMQASEWEADN